MRQVTSRVSIWWLTEALRYDNILQHGMTTSQGGTRQDRFERGRSDVVKTAILFGGQGERGLHAAVRHGLSTGAPLLTRALRAAGCSAESLFRDGGRVLERSHVLQPVLIALALTEALRLQDRGCETHFAAGHSIGELAAWAFAGAMTPEDAVEIAALRGRAMGRAARTHRGGMLALTDVDDAGLEHLLEIGRMHGQVTVALYNAPREIVLSGSLPALAAIAALCRSRSLPVEGAWHSPLMEQAKNDFAAGLSALNDVWRIRPVVSGLDGACVADASGMRSRLVELLTHPCRWTSVLATLSSHGVERFVIAGPGRVLRYLVRRNNPTADVRMS